VQPVAVLRDFGKADFAYTATMPHGKTRLTSPRRSVMNRISVPFRTPMPALAAALASLVLLLPLQAAAGEASGNIGHVFKSGKVSITPKHAFLVSGPNFEGKPIRQLILSDVDLAAAIKACDSLSCATWDLATGASVTFDDGPRLGYWVVADGQRKQHSGTARPASMSLTADTPNRLAGTWNMTDDGQGTTASVKFDATLLKNFKK
jgi:hypothetical protein